MTIAIGSLVDHRRRILAIVSASSGNLVEWFDFYTYAFCAIYFAPIFFPSSDPTVQLMNTAGVFALGFLMRPIGGWVFGLVADKYGRKRSMIISVCMMCFGSLVIAVLPGYEHVGIMAPITLLLARMLQGISVGGEYGTTATYMSEVSLPGKRGFFASFQYVTLIGGQLLAVLTVAILQQILDNESLRAWGWRIPFFIGAAAAVVSLLLRRSLEETSTVESRRSSHAGSIRNLWNKHRAASITVIGFTAGGSLMFYTFTTYMQKFLVNTAGMDAKTVSLIITLALLVYMCIQPLFGMLSDRIGRRNSMLCFGVLGTVSIIPLLLALKTVSSPPVAFLLVMVALLITSFYTAIGGILKAEMFPEEVRALGVGFTYAIGNAIFGGSAEFVALQFKANGMENGFYFYVTAVVFIGLFFSWRLPAKPDYLK